MNKNRQFEPIKVPTALDYTELFEHIPNQPRQVSNHIEPPRDT